MSEETTKLWCKRCRLVKERLHANTIQAPRKRTDMRAILWAQICEIDRKLAALGVRL